jgi:hypothetical protein
MTRPDPKAHMKSWVVQWKGNKPVLEHSTWAPGYTRGHCETEKEAIAAEVVSLMQHIADFREKWLNINILAEGQMSEVPEEANAFGEFLTVTETDDPHEQMTMPEGATSIVSDEDQAKVDPKWNHDGHADGDWSGYDDHQDH